MFKKLLTLSLILAFMLNSAGVAFEFPLTKQTKKEAVIPYDETLYLNRYLRSDNQIDCNAAVSDAVCSSLLVTKEELPLKSELKKDYVAYFYTITNNYEEPVVLQDIMNSQDAKKMAEVITKERRKKRFPKSLIFFPEAPVSVLAGGMAIGIMPLAYPMWYFFVDHKEANDLLGSALTYPVYMPLACVVKGTWYSMTTPLNLTKDKEADKKIKEDVFNISAKEFKPIMIKPQNDFKFTVLLDRKNSGSKIDLNFKPIFSSNSYSIYK